MGYQLREAIRNFKRLVDEGEAIESSSSACDLLEDDFVEREIELLSKGILSLSVVDEQSNPLKVEVAVTKKAMVPSDVQALFPNFDLDVVNLESFQLCFRISVTGQSGTGGFVKLLEYPPIMMTAAHNISILNEEDTKWHQNDRLIEVVSKSTREIATEVFSGELDNRQILVSNDDFASVRIIDNCDLAACLILAARLFEPSFIVDNVVPKIGTIVKKDGVTTGETTGVIKSSRNGLLWIKSESIFASAGDSGALLRNESGSVIGIVTRANGVEALAIPIRSVLMELEYLMREWFEGSDL